MRSMGTDLFSASPPDTSEAPMPRMARVVVPNFPHHVVQRGHNRNAVFVQETDYACYIETLSHWKRELGILVYA